MLHTHLHASGVILKLETQREATTKGKMDSQTRNTHKTLWMSQHNVFANRSHVRGYLHIEWGGVITSGHLQYIWRHILMPGVNWHVTLVIRSPESQVNGRCEQGLSQVCLYKWPLSTESERNRTESPQIKQHCRLKVMWAERNNIWFYCWWTLTVIACNAIIHVQMTPINMNYYHKKSKEVKGYSS